MSKRKKPEKAKIYFINNNSEVNNLIVEHLLEFALYSPKTKVAENLIIINGIEIELVRINSELTNIGIRDYYLKLLEKFQEDIDQGYFVEAFINPNLTSQETMGHCYYQEDKVISTLSTGENLAKRLKSNLSEDDFKAFLTPNEVIKPKVDVEHIPYPIEIDSDTFQEEKCEYIWNYEKMMSSIECSGSNMPNYFVNSKNPIAKFLLNKLASDYTSDQFPAFVLTSTLAHTKEYEPKVLEKIKKPIIK